MKGLIFILSLTSLLAQAEAPEFEDISPLVYEPQEPSQEIKLIDVEKVTYPTKAGASYCRRNPQMIDTIVVHHSETPSTETPLMINAYHLQRGTAADPWYMIAYTYVLNAPYPGSNKPKAQASYGRPIEYVGAHAGSDVFVPMDQFQKDLYKEKPIECGPKDGPVAVDPSILKGGKIKANVTSIGIVTIGNYAKFSRTNPNGSSPSKQPSDDLLDMYARLSCQLQKQYPRIKTLAYHDQYHSTSCPGTLQNHMKEIQSKAKEYGCEFKVLPKKYYK